MVYVIDSESSPYNHPNWRDGVRIGPVDEDRVTGFIPPFERDDRGIRARRARVWPPTPTATSTPPKGRTR